MSVEHELHMAKGYLKEKMSETERAIELIEKIVIPPELEEKKLGNKNE